MKMQGNLVDYSRAPKILGQRILSPDIPKEEAKIFVTNIERDTLTNPYYRRVLFTTDTMQLVVMKLFPGQNIPMETHEGTQFVRIEEGRALVQIENKRFYLLPDQIIMIPPRVQHYFENAGQGPLSLYSIYSPPEHAADKLQYDQEYILRSMRL